MTSQRYKHLLPKTLEAILGRPRLLRIARFCHYYARLDALQNNLESTGEALLQASLLKATRGAGPHIAIDIGAHFGSWSNSFLHFAAQAGQENNLHIIAFEPARESFDRLVRALPWNDDDHTRGKITARNLGVSSASGTASLYKRHDTSGCNSLHPSPAHDPESVEQVELTTVDLICSEYSVSEALVLKIDTEGHELDVLAGATSMLGDRRVAIIQFEYNWTWIPAHRFLKEAFDFFAPLGYRLAKLTPRGAQLHEQWTRDLEAFPSYGNYIAIRPDWLGAIPLVDA